MGLPAALPRDTEDVLRDTHLTKTQRRAVRLLLEPENTLEDVRKIMGLGIPSWREMTGSQPFRDALWQAAIVKADLAAPRILAGLIVSAERGRVDAAKLVFEIIGRHGVKEQAPTAVHVHLGSIPRPSRRASDVDGVAEELDDE